jgi:hypothetical protein
MRRVVVCRFSIVICRSVLFSVVSHCKVSFCIAVLCYTLSAIVSHCRFASLSVDLYCHLSFCSPLIIVDCSSVVSHCCSSSRISECSFASSKMSLVCVTLLTSHCRVATSFKIIAWQALSTTTDVRKLHDNSRIVSYIFCTFAKQVDM